MTNNFADIDIKTQQPLKGVDLSAPGELVLAEIEASLIAQDSTEISQ